MNVQLEKAIIYFIVAEPCRVIPTYLPYHLPYLSWELVSCYFMI